VPAPDEFTTDFDISPLEDKSDEAPEPLEDEHLESALDDDFADEDFADEDFDDEAGVEDDLEYLDDEDGSDSGTAAAVPTAPADRIPSRQRVVDLLQILREPPAGGARSRLVALHGLVARLEELLTDLAAAGDRDPAVRQLGEAMLRLQALLGQSQPAEADVLAVWAELEKALQSWLALGQTTQEPRREGFWK
jgi:hypothetical protein